ncbi:hypothetical protein OH491_07545 [Termitidicoccus mucosus]|uniref:Uncharacterized protein n=1 Tax=Termitidicoccus mucosus TaxID=1184151 RepID=A0A178ID76_9BACT|nr:hypothetical protein AW736_21530 [Opitutaceae bacterium TSB47]
MKSKILLTGLVCLLLANSTPARDDDLLIDSKNILDGEFIVVIKRGQDDAHAVMGGSGIKLSAIKEMLQTTKELSQQVNRLEKMLPGDGELIPQISPHSGDGPIVVTNYNGRYYEIRRSYIDTSDVKRTMSVTEELSRLVNDEMRRTIESQERRIEEQERTLRELKSQMEELRKNQK